MRKESFAGEKQNNTILLNLTLYKSQKGAGKLI